MRKFRIVLMWAVALLFGISAASAAEKPKYVFLFIGDGMSIPQRMMAEEFNMRLNGEGLVMNAFPYQAMTTTGSADSFITDSAASGTAIACGEKTKNGTIGLDASMERRLVSVAEVARDAGKKVGIITNVTINHATPAVFYGHNPSRGNGYELGLDLVKSNFDFFGGGGVDCHAEGETDIYDLAVQAGYKVFHEPREMLELKPGCGKVLAVLKDGAPPYVIDDPDGVHIADYLRKAIELLDGENGFFIMTEGGKIDWSCHANDAGTTVHEVIDLDNAIKVADEFAERHPDETLIVVTGDHETGGLTLGFDGTGYDFHVERLGYQTCSQDVFSDKLRDLAKSAVDNALKTEGTPLDGLSDKERSVKLIEKAEEVVTFDMFKPVITESFGLKFDGPKDDPMKLTTVEQNEIKEAFDRVGGDYREVSAITHTAVKILGNKAGLGWTSSAHTALPVNTTAKGVGADGFEGMIDNTDISKKLKKLVE
ncbi:MAG: alkaline phosphatase [Thermoguttaceae bacterium]|jgi:alkaline phosphatase